MVIIRFGIVIGCYFYYCNREDVKEGIYEFFLLRDINVIFMKKLNDFLEDLLSGRISLYDYFMF